MKKEEYYATRRDDIIEFVPEGALRILEVGCGTGLTGRAIKEKSQKSAPEVTGIEIEADIAEKAKKNIDRVIVGNVEELEFDFEKGYFDCIIYGDVLEHLINPWDIVARLGEFLKEKGYVVASIPNIAHYRTIKMLRKRRWDYRDRGILDIEHLRFFTLESMKDMFRKAGLEIIKIEHKISASKVKKILNKIFFGALLDYITEQYIIVAKKGVSVE